MKAVRDWFSIAMEWLLVGVGIGCLGFYAYESVEARRFQAERAAEFERAAEANAPVRVRAGGLVGMLDVPRLQLTAPVIEGDDEATLKRAAGHLPDTALPWEHGNTAIAGHRDGLFRPLKDIRIGDEIRFRSSRDEYRYRVTDTSIVQPDDVSVLEPRGHASLTLITCYPFYYVGNAPKRFIVRAVRESS
ncbi:MAG TPA: class D sortase [Vicinamibacterales bacterium]|nr:class D sortase [Vicinamibacterales bacterium]